MACHELWVYGELCFSNEVQDMFSHNTFFILVSFLVLWPALPALAELRIETTELGYIAERVVNDFFII